MGATYRLKTSQKLYLPFKRFVDICGAFVGILVLSPILLLAALLTKCTSKGPVIFKQQRIGRGEKKFYFYKFRSMKVDAPNVATSHIDASTQDHMVTKWGHIMRKTSLDELPQLFNILKGDMSFIGPRPGQIEGIEDDLIEARRSYIPGAFDVKPGLSGYAQIYLSRDHDFKKKAEMDAYYVRHLSMWLDIKLFVLSFLVLFGYKAGR